MVGYVVGDSVLGDEKSGDGNDGDDDAPDATKWPGDRKRKAEMRCRQQSMIRIASLWL